MDHAVTPEEMRKHVKVYWVIYGSLLTLTLVTVGIAYFHFPVPLAVAIALTVASIKGSLVALHFMHLISEKQIIRWTIVLTAVICTSLMGIAFFKF